jgi:sulfur relay (sulfurtransferase) DsrC/TusE family protein
MALKTMCKSEFVKEYYNLTNFHRFMYKMIKNHPESRAMLKAAGFKFGGREINLTVTQQEVFFEILG